MQCPHRHPLQLGRSFGPLPGIRPWTSAPGVGLCPERGAHRKHPHLPDGEFLDRLDLREVTLVENDTGRAQTLAGERPDCLARLVLASCEAFDNYPPGLPGRLIAVAARMPGGIGMLVQPIRLRALRRLPIAYGWMAKPIPHPAALATAIEVRATS